MQGALEPVDPRWILEALAERYDNTWVFAVDGIVGATPELLVRRERGLVTSRVLAGTIRRIVPGVVNVEVTIDLSGGNTVTSILTSESVRRLGLQEGMAVTGVIKASDVMLAVA